MKVLKKGLAITLAAAMVLTMAPTSADAAKKPKLSKSSATLKQGDKLKLSVKYVKKSVKVTWKSSTKAVKVAKKTTKGTAANTISAVKKGKAVVSASLKVGKKKPVLKCKVTVNAKSAAATATPTTAATATATATAAPQATATATVVPGTPTAKPTKKPTGTPKPTPAPTPTPMPEGNADDFTAIASDAAIKLDNSTYVTNDGCGTGRYDEKLDRIEINDVSAEALSQGSWAMPEGLTVAVGDELEFTVQGYFLGTETFRFWIGSATSGGCTPVALVKEVAEGEGVREDIGYPCEYDLDNNAVLTPDNRGDASNKVTANQVALVKKANGAFEVKFKLKAGTSQLDTKDAENPFDRFTLKGIHGSYINGLVIKNVYITGINGKAPEVGTGDEGNKEEGKIEIDSSAVAVDLSKYVAGSGNSKYDEATQKIVVNDTEGDTVGFVDLPTPIAQGKTAKVYVKGSYTGDTGFRFWLGDGQNAKGTVKVFDANTKNGEFLEVFDLDTKDGEATKLTVKGVATWAGGKGYISGLEIESISIVYPAE